MAATEVSVVGAGERPGFCLSADIFSGLDSSQKLGLGPGGC